MMAQTIAQDGSIRQSINEPYSERFDDDLFDAALLILNHDHGETDTESPRSPEPGAPQEKELFWQVMDAEFNGFDNSFESERPVKVPRVITVDSAMKFEPKSPIAKEEVSTREATSDISALWGNEVQKFTPAGPRRVNKRKEEINALRVQVEALQAQADFLRRLPRAIPCDAGLSDGGVLAWQLIAIQQYEQRKLSENENRRLRGLASEHRRVAKTIKRIAARQINGKTWEPFRSPPAHPRGGFANALMLDDPRIFPEMLATLGHMLMQTDSMVIETTGQALTTERHGYSHMKVKLQDSRKVPFDAISTASAVWNYMLLNETGTQHQWTSASDGSFQCEFVAYVDLGRFRGQAEGKLVVRRVEEATRTIIVRHSMFHCVTAGKTNRFLTMPMRHFLWAVIDRPPHIETVYSRIRTCAVSMPRLDIGDPHDPTREADIGELQEMCTQVAIQQSEQCYDMVDNMLLGTAPPAGTKGMACQAALNRSMANRLHG